MAITRGLILNRKIKARPVGHERSFKEYVDKGDRKSTEI